MCEGDANTRFFHTTTINRRRRNKIISLTYEVGNQIKDPNLLMKPSEGTLEASSPHHMSHLATKAVAMMTLHWSYLITGGHP